MGASQNLQPLLAGRKAVFERGRRILYVFEDRRKRLAGAPCAEPNMNNAPDDED